MKILMLAAADSIHTVRWANEYAKRGHDIYVVTNSDHKGKYDLFDNRVHLSYLKHVGTKAYYLNVHEIRKAVKEIDPEVINVCYASGYGTLARFARLKKVVLSVWGSDVYLFPYKSILHMHIIRKNLLYPGLIASTSSAMANQVRKLLPNKTLNIVETPFGVNTDVFYPREKRLIDSKFVFGTIKKLTDVYGIDVIIRAYNEFLINNPKAVRNTRLDIYGKGNQADDYRKLVDSLNLSNNVTISGYVPHNEVPELLASINVFCLGSRSESFGVSALEAMACGLPVIATKVDGFIEVMEDNKSGFLVDVDDYRQMANKMELLYKNPQLCISFGNEGRKIVTEKYVWENNVTIMENALRSVAESQCFYE